MDDYKRMEETRNKTRNLMNKRCLQRLFTGIGDIIAMCKFCKGYYFEPAGQVWLECELSGPFFVCESKDSPGAKLIVLNQQTNKDTCLKTSEISKVKLNTAQSCLYLKMKDEQVKGYWFYDKEDLHKIHDLVLKMIEPPQESPVLDTQTASQQLLAAIGLSADPSQK